MSSQDKRASTRYDVAIDMEIVRDGQSSHGQLVNLSLGGALIRALVEPSLQVGERISIWFPLPDLDKPLTAKAVVRWVDTAADGAIGIQFVTGFRAKETWALGRFLERQPAD